MSQAMQIQNDQEWITLRRAASLLGTTCYAVKSATISGYVRAKVLAGFPPLYSKSDVLAFKQARAA
jgi:hypothetical protein